MDEFIKRAAEIAADRKFQWAHFVVESIDKILQESLYEVYGESYSADFEIRFFERYAAEIGGQIATIQRLENQINDLKYKAAQAVHEYELSAVNAPVLEELEVVALDDKLLLKKAESSEAVSEALGKTTLGSIEDAMKKIADGDVEVAREAIALAKRKTELTKEKWKNINKHREMQVQRHNEDGHVLNYSERYIILKAHLVEEFKQTVQKAMVISGALSAFVGDDASIGELPGKSDDKVISKIVSWYQHSRRSYTRANSQAKYREKRWSFAEVGDPYDHSGLTVKEIRDIFKGGGAYVDFSDRTIDSSINTEACFILAIGVRVRFDPEVIVKEKLGSLNTSVWITPSDQYKFDTDVTMLSDPKLNVKEVPSRQSIHLSDVGQAEKVQWYRGPHIDHLRAYGGFTVWVDRAFSDSVPQGVAIEEVMTNFELFLRIKEYVQ